MTDFTCKTCSQVLDAPGMLDHISSSSHRNVILNPEGKTLKCEKCHDTDIHQLTLIKHDNERGLLSCQMCFAKSGTKQSIQYTLENGSLLEQVCSIYGTAMSTSKTSTETTLADDHEQSMDTLTNDMKSLNVSGNTENGVVSTSNFSLIQLKFC